MNRKIKEAKIIFLFIVIMFVFLTMYVFSYNEEKELIVLIDAGHGGRDGGAIGIDGTLEKNLDLSIALILQKRFEKAGIKVIMTRNIDMDLSKEDSENHKREDILKRVDLINNMPCDLYLSIHANSYPSNKVHGAQTFFKENDDSSKELAKTIQEEFIRNLKNTTRNCKSIKGKYLIDNAIKTGALIEVGFLSNDEELKLLKKIDYQEKLAECIFLGTLKYLEKNIP